jgi:cysteine desulfurase
VQAFGKVPVDARRAGIDLMAVSAHKIYGPKGVGALYVRRGVDIRPSITGGGHEFGMRPGTLNVPAIVGLGEACAICAAEMREEAERTGRLREGLLDRLRSAPQMEINGSMERRLPGNLNVSFRGVDSIELLNGLQDVALSTGSACTSTIVQPSHVLLAMGLEEWRVRSAVRIGIGRFQTAEEIEYAGGRIIEEVRVRRTE